MPECVVCGLQDFEERDGLYFCTTCQTQTQDLFVEEDEFEQAADTGQAIVDHRLQIKQKTERAAKPQEYKGRLWTIYEAYQIILKHQVEAFIRLGADPKLEDFVFRLWAVYLSKLQVAFTEDEHLYPPTLSKHVRHREKYGGDVEESMTPSRRLLRHHQRHTVNKVLPACPPVIEGEEFYEGDDPTQGPEELEEDLSTSEEEEEEAGWGNGEEQEGRVEGLGENDDENEEYFPEPGTKPKYTQTRLSMLRVMTAQPEWVSLPKLLSLCHLGLLYTNSAVTATDIVRLVEQGEIPYVEVSHLLPDNFKYSSYDPQLFLAQIPKPHALRHLTGKMAYFLDISHLPPVPVSLLVSRYIVKLGLPGELHGLVMLVMSQHPPQCRHTIRTGGRQARLPFYDGLAMAHIILTLKFWFGLDDSTEKELSAYSRELMEVLENKHDLFVFGDWKMHVACTLRPDQEVVSLFNPVDDKNVKDVEQVLKSYYKCNLHLKRPGRHYVGEGFARRGENSRYNKNVKEDIAMPFKLAAEKMEKTNHEAADSLDQSDVPMEEESSSDYRTRTRFACSSMKHITNPETFLKDLSRHGLTEDTLSSSCVDTDSESDYEIQYGMEDMSIDDYHEFLAPKAKRHKSAAKEAVRTMYKKIQSSNQNVSPEVQHQLNELRKRCVNASREFIVYKRIWKKDRHVSLDKYRHRSYSWLVSVCARILRCSPHELDMMVLHLSKVHFSFSAKKAGILMPDMKSFLVKYFLPVEKSAD